MYIDTGKSKGNKRVLLRTSERSNGKVVHRTIANLSNCSPRELAAISWALKNKSFFFKSEKPLLAEAERQGLSAGAVWTVFQIARELGVAGALGDDRAGKLALWQIIARVLDQGSRLSAARLAGTHAACDILGLDAFNEETLYANLKWLSRNQAAIEDRLFQRRAGKKTAIYLYDVTSSYVEGERNTMAAFGYNRDGKKGKKQIVVGLLCDEDGDPLSVEVFKGNTGDCATVSAQLDKIAGRFGGREIIFVGDRGMVKSKQIKDLEGREYHYITALTKAQIETLLKQDVVQMSLFDEELCEVDDGELRYVLRRNPVRAAETAASRDGRIKKITDLTANVNTYLAGSPKADPGKALAKVLAKAARLKVQCLLKISVSGRVIRAEPDAGEMAEAAKLDGCYALKTDVSKDVAGKETVHARYKDLSRVEWAFRTSKTGELEMRPIFVRTEDSTKGHVFVVMLAYRIIRELARRWGKLNLTVEEGLRELDQLCAVEIVSGETVLCQRFPAPRESSAKLLAAANIKLPEFLPSRNVIVATRKNLADKRQKHRNQ